jgi:hypothetical protein
MSINFCTISASSIDSFCGARRAVVLNNLLAEFRPEPPVTTPKRGGGPIFAGIRREEEPKTPVYFELDHVTVSATFQDMSGSDTLDMTGQLDFVIVTDLEFNASNVHVNITDLSFNKHASH